MSPHHANRALLSLRVEERDFAINHPAALEYALLEELSFVRREAQVEANFAYEDWRRRPCGDRYAVYLAAQDRADAAQDELAHYTRRVTA
jgi:acyl-CoA reductase-like NAD-dependent aldehyde dehydrogenase